jgi:hypothetical protein
MQPLHSLRIRGAVQTADVVELLHIHASLFHLHSYSQHTSRPAALPATVT